MECGMARGRCAAVTGRGRVTAVCRSPHCGGRQVSDRRPFCSEHVAIFDRVAIELDMPRNRAHRRTPEQGTLTCRLRGCDGAPQKHSALCYRHHSIPDHVVEIVIPTARDDGRCFWVDAGCPRFPKRPGRSVCPPCGSAGAYAGTCAADNCTSPPKGGGEWCGRHQNYIANHEADERKAAKRAEDQAAYEAAKQRLGR